MVDIPNNQKLMLQESVEENTSEVSRLAQDIGQLCKLREQFDRGSEEELLISEIIWEERELIPIIKRAIYADQKRIAKLS